MRNRPSKARLCPPRSNTRFHAWLAKLPPMEQIEGGNAVLSVIRRER